MLHMEVHQLGGRHHTAVQIGILLAARRGPTYRRVWRKERSWKLTFSRQCEAGRRTKARSVVVPVWHRKPPKQLTCELRERIIARAHDHDAIATTGQTDQHVAAGDAVRKSEGLSTTPLDFANNIAAADAAVDRAAEINGLGHDQNVLSLQAACKVVHQGVP